MPSKSDFVALELLENAVNLELSTPKFTRIRKVPLRFEKPLVVTSTSALFSLPSEF